MLVLTRRADEAILIGSDIRIVLLKIDGNRVRIGIEAPPDIGVQREEIAVPQDGHELAG